MLSHHVGKPSLQPDASFVKDLMQENEELHAFANELRTTMQVVVDNRRKQVRECGTERERDTVQVAARLRHVLLVV